VPESTAFFQLFCKATYISENKGGLPCGGSDRIDRRFDDVVPDAAQHEMVRC
jgi:hypothetical protein